MTDQLVIYNTLTRKKEKFTPINKRKINLYVCGITVYDYCHLGHARVLISFDVIVRYLKFIGFDVNYVRNITDIDDKIIKRANENNEKWSDVTKRFITAMQEDEAALWIEPPNYEPRATEHINEIISMIQTLIDKNHAYVGMDGDVFYSIKSFSDYGKLSNRDLDNMRVGVRVEANEAKHDFLDFVLWKLAKSGEPSWDSPWGPGRPGWHIECSAMSTECLGANFDIHGGGPDLIFPHHENEIAQSEAATGQPFANTWMHVGTLQVDDQKMSKSLNNFFTIRDVLIKYPAETIRYFMIASHYRSPLNYTEAALQLAHASLGRMYTALRGVDIIDGDDEIGATYQKGFMDAMNDDFNTPQALAVLFDCCREINSVQKTDPMLAGKLASRLKHLGAIIGILHSDPDEFLQMSDKNLDRRIIDDLLAARNQARENKQWEEADKIRQRLEDMGIIIEDNELGSQWRIAD